MLIIRQMLQREASAGQAVWWEVKLFVDNFGDTFWKQGWPGFAITHDLEEGDILKFRYSGLGCLSVKLFDGSQCRCFYRPLLMSDDDRPDGE